MDLYRQENRVVEACQDLINTLKSGLFEYKETNPQLSWRAVAKNVRCNRYVLNKIIHDDGLVSPDKSYDIFDLFRMAAVLSSKNIHSRSQVNNAIASLFDVIKPQNEDFFSPSERVS